MESEVIPNGSSGNEATETGELMSQLRYGSMESMLNIMFEVSSSLNWEE